MRQLLVLMSFIFLSIPAFAKAPFSSLYFSFKNENTLGFRVNYFEGHGIQADSHLVLREGEAVTFSNFIMIEDSPLCVNESKKISCAFSFKALLPQCAIAGAYCELSAATEVQNVTLNFTVDASDKQDYKFSGKIITENGQEFVLENKDLRSFKN